MDELVIPCREVRLRMLMFSLLSVAVASSYLSAIFAAEINGGDSMFGADDQSRIIELGSTKEENLNCFLRLDQFLADKWTVELGLDSVSKPEDSPVVVNRLEEDDEVPVHPLTADTRNMLDGLKICANNLTKKLKNPKTIQCMEDLVINEIEIDYLISVPELFNFSLPVPFLPFLDIRELFKVLYQNRTVEELSVDESRVLQVAGDYVRKDKSGRDKVFVLDQACEWKNLESLRRLEGKSEAKFQEFKQQVIRLICLRVAQEVFKGGDLKPGTWITVYRRWAPVRLQNIKDLESTINNLKSQRFTTEELCGYATTLGNFFAEQELKVILPGRSSPLHLNIGELKVKSKSKEARLCKNGVTRDCERFRVMKKSYEEDLKCVESFGKLLTNHILYSIIKQYANIEPRITFPELVCKRSAKPEKIAVRYCRCVGSFCTFRDVGEINANLYKLTNNVVTRV